MQSTPARRDAGLILALDLGTSSSRAMLYDAAAGAALDGAIHQIKHEARNGPDGSATLEPDQIVEELVRCAEAVLPAAGGRPVLGVGVSSFWHSIVGVAENGAARTQILLWSDRRAIPQAEALRGEIDAAAYSQTTGCPLHVSYPLAKLRWLAEARADDFAASARFVSPGEYLFDALFGLGKATCSISMASGTGLFNQANLAWDAETLSHVPGLTAQRLSTIGDDAVRGLTGAYRTRLGAVADVPWFPALGDGACSNIGCGAARPGDLALMIGTSGALRVMVPGAEPPPLPAGLWRYQIDAHRFLLGGALSNGGNVWAWLKHTLEMPDVENDAIEAALETLPPDGHGLTVLPFYSGERAPLWRDDLRATIHGLSISTSRMEIVRAHLEAVAYRFAAVREALKPVINGTDRVIGTGAGLLSSPVWAQIIADAIGEPIEISSEEQASSRGAALWVREKLELGAIEDAPRAEIARTVAPQGGNTKIYRAARARQEALLACLPK